MTDDEKSRSRELHVADLPTAFIQNILASETSTSDVSRKQINNMLSDTNAHAKNRLIDNLVGSESLNFKLLNDKMIKNTAHVHLSYSILFFAPSTSASSYYRQDTKHSDMTRY